MATNKHFLDYAGLATLWSIITNRFADKSAAVNKLTLKTSTDGKTQTIVGTMVDSTATPTEVVLPNASQEHAGLMSIEHFAAVRDLQTNIDKFAPFAGLQLGSASDKNEVSLAGRKATIGLEYQTERASNGTVNKAYIALLDPMYPKTGHWVETTKEVYDTAESKTSFQAVKVGDTGTYKYYMWTNSEIGASNPTPAGVAGPVNALGEPIYNQPISKIDVTELVKTGLLTNSDVVINPEGLATGTYLKLTFNATNDKGDLIPQDQYINVTDLVEIYEAGEGIAITEITGTEMKDDVRTGKINVLAATDTTLGAFKTGYKVADGGNAKTYAVQLDATNKAYVAVPWNETTVNVSTPAANDADKGIYALDQDGKSYLVVTDNSETSTSENDGSKTTKYNFSVTVGEGIRNAEALARTGVQQIAVNNTYAEGDTQAKGTDFLVVSAPENLGGKGTKVTVDLTTSAKDSLALADSAVQEVKVANYTDGDRAAATGSNDIVITPTDDADKKGKKGYTIALGDRTKNSLNLADSAVQEINMMGTTLTKTSKAYTAEQATLAMSLGSAANVNITNDSEFKAESLTSNVAGPGDASTPRKTVATAEAVKTYVDAVAASTKTAYENLITSTVQSLDSDITADKSGGTSHAQEVDAQQVFTKIVITDGKLDATASTKAYLTISDITDFRSLTEDEIYKICGATKPTPTPEV